jgi:hypothetical protein
LHFPRNRLSYANVMSTVAVFLALGGATAFAAQQLGRNSVGARQLKKDAVTAAKIKDGAVTGGKVADGAVGPDQLAGAAVSNSELADGAVTGAKIANASVTADKLDPSLPFAQVVHRITGTPSVPFPSTANPVDYPLDGPFFTQAAGEDDLLLGSITARFPASCKSPRTFEAFLRVDRAGPGLSPTETVGAASFFDESEGEATRTAQFGALVRSAAFLTAPPSPTPHKFSIDLSRSSCGAGSPAGAVATATGARIDVVGIR